MGTSIAYQEAHLGDNRTLTIIVVNCCMLALAYFAVTLRFISRHLVRAPLKADDWMIVAALTFTTGHIAGDLVCVHFGLGRHAVLIKDPAAFGKALLSTETIYNFAVPSIKFSILLLYKRLFPSRRFAMVLWGVASFVCAYSITQTFTFLFQCVPIDSDWDKMIEGRCINVGAVLIAMSSLNVVTDVVLLCLPVKPLWRLKISKTRRIQLISIFFLGGFVCVISIIRATTVSQVSLTDPSWDDVNGATWSAIEICVGIVSACLPTLRPLYNRIFYGSATMTSRSAPTDNNQPRSYGNSNSHQRPSTKVSSGVRSWLQIDDGKSNIDSTRRTDRSEGREGDGEWEMQEVGANGILTARAKAEEEQETQKGLGIAITTNVKIEPRDLEAGTGE